MRTHVLSWSGGGVLAGILLLAACVEEPSAPRIPSLGRPASSLAAAGGRPHLIPNAVRYRDKGHHPATGRSGSAQLALRAMLDVKGVTTVEVTTGAFDTIPGPGTIARTQVKAFNPKGDLLFTRNENGLSGGGFASVRYPGLGWRSLVQVQANVRDVDGRRTDVVTVRDTIVFRPDLTVFRLELPMEARAGVPLPITAAILEKRGSLGARANCVLYVDGARVDSARGIWVDAGGLVSCGFMHVFPQLRRYDVTVQVENVRPGDFDDSNNARSATLEMRNVFAYYASFDSRQSTYWNRYSWTASSPDSTSGYRWAYESKDSSRYEYANLSATTPRVFVFPLARVRIAQQTGTLVLQDTTFPLAATYPATDTSDACAFSYGDGWGFSVCSGTTHGAATSVTYSRYGGEVIYYSAELSSSWYPGGSDDYYSSTSWTDRWGSPPVPWLGSTFDFAVALDDGAGVWMTYPKVPLQPFSYGWPGAPYCDTWDDPSGHYSSCSDSGYWESGASGSISGGPDVLPTP